MKIHFWGATEDVTGSMTFVQLPEGNIMVDCGLTQGSEETERTNYLPLPPHAAQSIKAVIITHAHLDHSGYLPRLVKNGFRGEIYCTPATAKLMRIILLDSAGLAEDGFYEESDVVMTMKLVRPREWNDRFLVAGAEVSLVPAGHILGASSVIIRNNGKKVLFSGDLGRTADPILLPYPPSPQADVVIMESTYGGKVQKGDMEKELHSFLMTVSREARVGIIASFAVARAQTLLTMIHEFHERHPEDKVRVVFDSPMMKEANRVYLQYSQMTSRAEALYTALDSADAIEYQREWESLKKKQGPLVIVSSSGMLTGGRINRHLANWKDDAKAILFLPGYQAEGTPGRSFVEGHRSFRGPNEETLTWLGEVWTSEAFSSHADQQELLTWVGTENKDAAIYLLHGETESKRTLSQKLTELGYKNVRIPVKGEMLALE